jgi:oligosaccharide repeat unit polymerase
MWSGPGLNLITLFVLVGLSIWNFRFGKRHILYPPFLFCLVWAIAYFAYVTFPMEINEITPSTIEVFVFGAMAFTLGGTLVMVLLRSRPSSVIRTTPVDTSRGARALPFFKMLLVVSVALLPFFYLEVRQLGLIGGGGDFFKDARSQMSVMANEQNYTYSSRVMGEAPTLAVLVFFLFVFESVNGTVSRFWLGASFVNAGLFAVLTTGRTTLLMMTVGVIASRTIRRDRPPFRTILIGLVVFTVLFVSLVFLFKQIDVSRPIVDTVVTYTFGYLAGPLVAFDEVVYAPWRFALDVNHTFSPIMKMVAPLLGIAYQPPPLLDSYVFIPFPFNTYSVYKFYFLDFGFYGTLLVVFLFAIIQTWLFHKARSGGPIYVFVFTVTLYALVTSVFDDAYFQWVYYCKVLLFSVLCYRVIPWLAREKRRHRGELGLRRHGASPQTASAAREV